MKSIISVSNLQKSFNNQAVLKGVSFEKEKHFRYFEWRQQ